MVATSASAFHSSTTGKFLDEEAARLASDGVNFSLSASTLLLGRPYAQRATGSAGK
jgi:hypothetical protein